MSDYRIDEHSVSDTDVIGAWVVIGVCLVVFIATLVL